MSISEKRLRKYVEEDKIYQDYKKSNKEPSYFERFCYVHCWDIENVLEENQQLKEDIEDLVNQKEMMFKNMQLNQLKVCELAKVLDEIREYIENHMIATETEDCLLQILDKVK